MSQAQRTIFIIDDDASVRKAVGRLLRSAGMIVETFETAEDFLSLTEHKAPACFILDVHLPGLNGLELQTRLNANGRKTPTIFITAYPDDQVRDLALRCGAIAYLPKPFDERSLLDAVERAFRKASLNMPANKERAP